MNLESELLRELSAHEELLWTGRPKTGLIFRTLDLFLVPFTACWFGGACMFELTAVANRIIPLGIFGLFFVGVGSYFFAGRFIYDVVRRKNTVYGITPDRVIIRSGIFSRNVKSLKIKILSEVSLREKRNGTGTILLGSLDWRSMGYDNVNWPGARNAPSLESIGNARKVYNLILEQQQK